MSLPTNTHLLEEDHFHNYFNAWLAAHDQHLQELRSASETLTQTTSLSEQETHLRPLLNRVVAHYEEYYRVKGEWCHGNVIELLSPTWTTTLEDAYMWVGGWRPSMAFRLLSSVMRIQEQPNLDQLGFLSPSQFTRVTELQGMVLQEEKYISEKMAKAQATGADQDLVELSLMAEETVDEEKVDEALAGKEGKFEKAVEKADDLRLRTLKGVIDILNPLEAVHFLIAAAELQLKFHEWGFRQDLSKM